MKSEETENKKDIQVAAIVTTDVPSFVQEEKDERALRNIEYIPFGSDNLYPQVLATLYRKSVALRSILKSKTTFVLSGGFQLDDTNTAGLEWIHNINNKGESLDDVTEKFLTDRGVVGNSYFEVVTDKKRSFVNVFHIQSVKCRKAKDKDYILVHPNWELYKKNDKKIVEYPIFPNFESIDGFDRSIYHMADYEPDFDNYGIPSYIAALDSAAIGYKTNKWNVSRLDNSFQTSGVLVVDGNMSDKDAKELKDEFQDSMTGEGNQGNILFIIKKLGGEGTEFTPINNNAEGDWGQLHTQSNDDILLACGWKKSLAGLPESTGFDTDRVLNDYQVVKSTYIVKEQNKLIKVIKKINEVTINIDLDGLAINNVPPTSLLTKLTADKFVRKWEARREAGLEYDQEDETQMKYIDESTTADSTTSISNKVTASVYNKIKSLFK